MNDGKPLLNRGLYEFKSFRLDALAGVLSQSDVPVKLAPKVYQALLLLVSSDGRIVTKDEMFAELWQDTFVEDNALSYTISQLRKVLAAYEPETTFIETVPRRGFRFVADVREVETGLTAQHASGLVVEKQTIEETWIEETNEDRDISTPKLPPAPKNTSTKYFIAAALLFAVFPVVGAVWYFQRSSPTDEIKTIAVLPLRDLDGGEQTRPLVMGLTDALILQLGRSEKIVVRPLRSVMTFAETETDPIVIGKNLSVDAVIVWNLQKTGERLRITARLLRVSDGKQSWNEVFEESEGDIFNIQDAVSTRAANSLFANLNERDLQKIHKRSTESNEAYEAYLRGRYHWSKRDLEGFTKAQGLFEQAVALDPKFAEAHAGLADVHLGFYDYGYKRADDTIPQAMNAVNRTLKLNPSLSDVYSTLASIEFLHNKNWQAAEANFKQSIELEPNNSSTHLRYGMVLTYKGDFEKGLAALRIAEKLDPTSPVVLSNIGYNLFCTKHWDEAETHLQQIIGSHPDFSLPYWYLGTLYFELAKYDESLEYYFKAFEIDEGNSELTNKIKELRKTESEAQVFKVWREGLEARYAAGYFPPSNIALVAALGKDREQTIKWLREAERLRDPWLIQVLHDPEYRFLQGDPEFDQLIVSLNFEQ